MSTPLLPLDQPMVFDFTTATGHKGTVTGIGQWGVLDGRWYIAPVSGGRIWREDTYVIPADATITGIRPRAATIAEGFAR
jgi:hypothetical protein